MRKLLMALMLCMLPLLGVATTGPASAAAPGNMTLLDKLSTAQSTVDEVRYRCRTRCYRVCARWSRSGYCRYWTRRCARQCYRW
jgi:hypothetical protein